MKFLGLAGAILIAGLSACGGGSSVAPLPSVATAAPTIAPQFLHPQAVGTIPTLAFQGVILPANGQQLDNGATYTLAAAVPVYNFGSTPTVAYEFAANSDGLPVAVQVGAATTFASPVFSSTGGIEQAYVINGKTAIFCIEDGYNHNDGAFRLQPPDLDGRQFVDYFACAGNPFS